MESVILLLQKTLLKSNILVQQYNRNAEPLLTHYSHYPPPPDPPLSVEKCPSFNTLVLNLLVECGALFCYKNCIFPLLDSIYAPRMAHVFPCIQQTLTLLLIFHVPMRSYSWAVGRANKVNVKGF